MDDTLSRRMAFLLEADRLKSVERANVLMDLSRPENAAEHSWHAALSALVLAPYAPPAADADAAIAHLLVHDLVEIDAGDSPIHLRRDPVEQAAAEARAADRLFALLPARQGAALRRSWEAFEAAATPSAAWAKTLDHVSGLLQAMIAPAPLPDHVAICRDSLAPGRAAALETTCPPVHAAILGILIGRRPTGDLGRRLAFLAEADRLKSVVRATRLADGSRRENSAEHSWHLALFALVLAPHAPDGVDVARAIRLLIAHDLVEIDAGDVPLFAAADGREEAERAAADRLFGLLPDAQAAALRALWDEFEAGGTPTARFARALDRVQPPLLNLANGGGSWLEYDVTEAQVRERVGTEVAAGAPILWDWLRPKIAAFFAG